MIRTEAEWPRRARALEWLLGLPTPEWVNQEPGGIRIDRRAGRGPGLPIVPREFKAAADVDFILESPRERMWHLTDCLKRGGGLDLVLGVWPYLLFAVLVDGPEGSDGPLGDLRGGMGLDGGLGEDRFVLRLFSGSPAWAAPPEQVGWRLPLSRDAFRAGSPLYYPASLDHLDYRLHGSLGRDYVAGLESQGVFEHREMGIRPRA
jgi:hypothetical protein